MSGSPPRSPVGRIVLLLALLGLVALFAGLAVWQVERRAWKHALIERVTQRVDAAPVDAPARTRWPTIGRADDEYRHVHASGRFLGGRDTFVRAATVLGSGYWVVTPLQRQDGSVILVNRGFVTDRTHVVDPGPSTTVTGLLRITEPGGSFLQKNDPAHDLWVSRDVQAIATARALNDVAPYFIDAGADAANDADGGVAAAARGVPVGGLTIVAFSDNHLLYAIIWTVLALMPAWAAWRVLRLRR